MNNRNWFAEMIKKFARRDGLGTKTEKNDWVHCCAEQRKNKIGKGKNPLTFILDENIMESHL